MTRITPVYAAGLAVLFLVLSLRVILARRAKNVGFGSAGDPDLERRVRVHGNFAEYTPLALLLIWMAETRGTATVLVHALCVCLFVGRLAHALGVSRQRTDELGRILGMAGSQTAIFGAAVMIVLT